MASRQWLRGIALGILAVVLAGCESVVRDQTTREFVDDSAITARVKARLAREPGVSAPGITVDTLNGVVILAGFVDDGAQREKAIAAARDVPGVRDVKGDGLVLKRERATN